MPVSKKNITDFLPLSKTIPVLDVRSPLEFEHAHIPNAISFPIFNNEERKEIGTTYKQVGREQAIKIGLDRFGKKMVQLVEQAESILTERKSDSKIVAVHCWRGGMRSAAVAWLLDLYGFKVYLLEGGYKSYRNWALKQFEKPYQLNIISGFTGSNKTGLIQHLKENNEAVVDLETLACHKGSAFGSLGMPIQPSQEMFENLFARELWNNSLGDAPKSIWIEDESQRIGNVNIPTPFFKLMREQPILFMDIAFNERLKFITETYGVHPKDKLLSCIVRIQKKLGGLETKEAIAFLEQGKVIDCFSILLKYYDRLYLKSSMKRKDTVRNIQKIKVESTNPELNAKQIKTYAGK